MPPGDPHHAPASHGALRLARGGRIERERLQRVRIDGRDYHGLAGDTVASMLLAHGVRLLGRSRSFHRPRGILSAGAHEPNALLTVGHRADRLVNIPATLLEVGEGLVARTQHGWPSLRWDLLELQFLLSPWMVAGAVFKTWKGPLAGTWRAAERVLRRLPALGRTSDLPDPDHYEIHHAHCDVLVVGSGPAGLMAAWGAAQAGLDVMLVEQDFDLGGCLLGHPLDSAPARWLAFVLQQLADTGRVRVLPRATAFASDAGPRIAVAERMAPGPTDPTGGRSRERLHQVQARRVVVATGAAEQPLLFAGNDKPGVMLADAVAHYLHRYAVLPGRHAVVATACDSAYGSAIALAGAGAQVHLVDLRPEVAPSLAAQARAAGVDLRVGWTVTQVSGWPHAHDCMLAPWDMASGRVVARAGESVAVDLVAMSGGWSPDRRLAEACFDGGLEVPGSGMAGRVVVGGAAGAQTWQAALHDGWQAARSAAAACGRVLDAGCPPGPDLPEVTLASAPVRPVPGGKGMVVVDFQQDVRLQDVALAVREGYDTPGQLAAYTGVGQGADQGRRAWPQVLALLPGQRSGHAAPAPAWPPVLPVAVGTLAGGAVHAPVAPVRRGPLHAWHLMQGAQMADAGGWAQPQWYRSHGMDRVAACEAEVGFVLAQAGIADLTGPGLWEVQGPDAAMLLWRAGFTTSEGQQDLVPGCAIRGLLPRADGAVCAPLRVVAADDGQRIWLRAPAELADAVADRLGALLQDDAALQVTLTDMADQWAALCVAGARALDLLRAAFPQEASAIGSGDLQRIEGQGALAGVPLCLLDAGWPGLPACEIRVPTHALPALREHMSAAGRPWNLRPFGACALGVLRAVAGEPGPAELAQQGLRPGQMGIRQDAAPPPEHGGDAPAAPADGRMAVVGLEALDADEPPEAGSFLFFEDDLVQGLGRGRVTTVLHGLRPGGAVALGLLQGGWAHRGRALVAASPVQGREYRLRVTELSMPPPALLLPGPLSEAGPEPKRVIPPEPPHPEPLGQRAPGPFADLQDAERPSASGRVGVRLVAVGPLPAWRVATWPSGAAALESVVGEMASGHPSHAVPPGQSGRPVPSVHGRPVRCGPDAFLLWHSPPTTDGRVALAGGPTVATLTDLGQAYASLCVSGPDSRALLARFWSLDLRDGAFTVGAARCLPGDAACGRSADCVLLRTGAQDYELRIPTSLARHWLDALVDAAREFGVSVVVPGAGQPPASTSTRQS